MPSNTTAASASKQSVERFIASSKAASTFKMAHPSRTFAKLNRSSEGDVTVKSSIRDAFETDHSDDDRGQWTEVATEKKAMSIPD